MTSKLNPAKVYKFYSDPGHGWLAVKRDLLIELGIFEKITTYSYQKGQTVYLEEDLDAGTFIKALRDRGIEPKFKEVSHDYYSPIRSYDSFSNK